jgi:hypothetical protein
VEFKRGIQKTSERATKRGQRVQIRHAKNCKGNAEQKVTEPSEYGNGSGKRA